MTTTLSGLRLGVVSNPLARLNRRRPSILAALASRPDVPMVTFRGEPDLPLRLQDMLAKGTTDLIVDGGDGTVAATVSGLLQLKGARDLPRLILVPSGTTNLVATGLGARGRRSTLLSRLDALSPAALDAHTLTHAPMEVDRGVGLPLMHGFLAGLGAFHSGTLHAQQRVRQLGLRNGAAVALGLAAGLWRSLRGPEHETLFAGDPISLSVDRAHEPGDQRLLLLVSVLDRLSMGLRPFWGAGSQSLHWLSIAARPRGLAAALPRILAGRPALWMDGAGYRSGRANVLDIRTRRPFILDGEVVEPGPHGTIGIRQARPLRFLRLP